MKKIALLWVLCTSSTLLYATPANPQITETFFNTIQLDQSIEKLSDHTTFQALTEQIMQYHNIPRTPENQTRVYNVVKNFYSNDRYKQKTQQKLTQIYQQNMTEEEMQEWISFYQTPIGKSILNNNDFKDKIMSAVEQIFPENSEPSPQAQQKLSQTMEKFFQR